MTSAVAGLFLGLFLLQELGDELLAQHEEELPGFITEFLLHGLLPEPPNDDPEHNHPDHPDR